MSSVVFVGDCTTTTALATLAAWPPHGGDAILVECDPSGGSAAAWLDLAPTPSLSTAVTSTRAEVLRDGSTDVLRRQVEPVIRRSTSGVRVLTAPPGRREAGSAVREALHVVLPAVASRPGTVLLDAGSVEPDQTLIDLADRVVLVHRLHAASPRAAAVRLERAAERVTDIGDLPDLALAVIGDAPFDLDEVVDFVAPGRVAWSLPDDPLAAAVLAGRDGVSARRLARLPLLRAARELAADLATSPDRDPLAASDVTAGAFDLDAQVVRVEGVVR